MAAPIIHFEIHASDPKSCCEFYENVLGWTSNGVPQMDGYWILNTREKPEDGINGGMLIRKGNDPPADAPVNGFVCMAQVSDLDHVLETAIAAGGSVALAPFELEGVGRVSYIKDPSNNTLGLLQPKD